MKDHESLEPQVYTTKQIAQMFQISKFTLEGWRREGVGPEYYKVGQRVLYDISAVKNYLEQNKVLTSDSL